MRLFREGDRVKVEYEATVVTDPSTFYQDRTTLRREGHGGQSGRPLINVPSEYITLIEPKYAVGEFYRDARGRVFRFNGGDWFKCEGHGTYCGNDIPVRPLHKLVPETTN